MPPPWRLAGSGWIFLFTFPHAFLRSGGFVPRELGEGFEGQLGALLLVDYQRSPVGGYRELLFLVGRNLRWRNHRLSISRIYVSSEASALSGQENWAIPKRSAELETIPRQDGGERVIVVEKGLAQVDVTVAPAKGVPLPVLGPLVPPSWRTILQFQDGRTYRTRLRGRGILRPARLLDFRTLPGVFPDVKRGELVAGWRISGLRLRLPPARTLRGPIILR